MVFLLWVCFCRVHQSGGPYGDRVRGDGVRGVLREADLHPHQQHHRWVQLNLVRFIKFGTFF